MAHGGSVSQAIVPVLLCGHDAGHDAGHEPGTSRSDGGHDPEATR